MRVTSVSDVRNVYILPLNKEGNTKKIDMKFSNTFTHILMSLDNITTNLSMIIEKNELNCAVKKV